ncbi:MAG: nucleotidyl transferase AbiEii/AbiGii toxin family protein [Lachnospiraceae bacterium]|nr:nucleotidyl transferase AbiEii/AbiGii toxin family protein [Lachnospiraceae bacterium]
MLSRNMYTSEYINDLYKKTGNDPTLLERVVYAFGLLEAIKRVGLPFCFKGGTALMLLLDRPRRLSTDIDIIVEPGTDIDEYIRKAGEIFPFLDVEEHVRVGKNDIEKRHFKFKYRSPRSERDVTILLDVLFEKIQYKTCILKPIKNELLLTEGEELSVSIPNVNGILGDKMTAFAPHTTGIPFGVDKELEVIKQLYDCTSLFDAMTDFSEVCESYHRIVYSEMAYRGLSISAEDVLKDTINGCLCIASRGIPNGEDYTYFKDGISRIRNHIIGGRFGGDVAGAYAGRVMYLAAAMLTGQETLIKINNPGEYAGQKLEIEKPKRFSYMRIVDPVSYGYLIEAAKLLQGTEFVS